MSLNNPQSTFQEKLERATELLYWHNYADALPLFESLVNEAPDHPEAKLGWAQTLFGLDRFSAAVEAYDQLILGYGETVEYLLGRAKARFESSDYEGTIGDCDRVLELHPNHPHALAYRGAGYLCDDEHETGYDDITLAVKLDPDFAFGQFFLGRALAGEDSLDEALVAYNRAIELDPNNAWHYSWRAHVWSAWGEDEKADADNDRSMQIKPNANAYHSRAHRWDGKGEFNKAYEDFAEAIRLEPKNTRHYNCRCSMLTSLGEYDLAYEDHETARLITEAAENEEDAMNLTAENRLLVYNLIQEHLAQTPMEEVEVTERNFPTRMAADLQVAIDKLADSGFEVLQFYALNQHSQPPSNFTQLYTKDRRNPPTPVTPQYIEVDIGEEEPIRCLKFGTWLVRKDGVNFVVLLDTVHHYQHIHFQVAAAQGAEKKAAVQGFFNYLEETIKKANCYRGKVLSLEYQESYNGQNVGVLVHNIRTVARDQVILPEATITLLERNVIQFVKQRPRLGELGLTTKKGLLFYGPPGTGKTHTIHYLAKSVPGQTTFLIAAEQVGMISEYMTLARLLQPSMVVIEDVDLIARDRTTMHTAVEEVLLNKLLNEMDGLKGDSNILFVLTTNRPEKLEAALAARPGRIDQAIEFPYPNPEGRAKLVKLYAKGMEVPPEVADVVVRKTDRVSASFIKELMRRATQFYLEREGTGAMQIEDVENALEEMLFSGGSLNRAMLGVGGATFGEEE